MNLVKVCFIQMFLMLFLGLLFNSVIHFYIRIQNIEPHAKKKKISV